MDAVLRSQWWWSQLDDPVLQCADADYFIDEVGGGLNFTSFFKSNTGEFEAEFDGFDLFDDPDEPDLEPHDNLLEPFFSSAELGIQTVRNGNIIGFDLAHRGSVSMAPRDSGFQSAAYQTRSRVTFKPVNTVDPNAPLELNFDIDFDFSLTDPNENLTSGAALGGMGVTLEDDGPFFDFSVVAELDLEIDDEPQFFGLDDGMVDVRFNSDPDIDDTFDIEIDIDIELPGPSNDPIMPGEELILEIDS